VIIFFKAIGWSNSFHLCYYFDIMKFHVFCNATSKLSLFISKCATFVLFYFIYSMFTHQCFSIEVIICPNMNPHGKIITIFHNQTFFHRQEDVECNSIIVFTSFLYVFIILLPFILIFNFLPCFGTYLNHYNYNYNYLFALNFDVLHIFI
jgi:hypothetical protein